MLKRSEASSIGILRNGTLCDGLKGKENSSSVDINYGNVKLGQERIVGKISFGRRFPSEDIWWILEFKRFGKLVSR